VAALKSIMVLKFYFARTDYELRKILKSRNFKGIFAKKAGDYLIVT
jgi:hypothetical protein